MEIQVGELIKKAKVSRCGDGDYPVLSMTMHDGLMFQNDRFKKQIASVDQSNYQVVKRHQLVESFPIDEGVLAVQELTEEGIVSPAYKIWDVNMDRVIPVYLELALRSPRSIEYYKSKLRGTTARRRSITDAEFCAMQIKLPDLKEQERIIELISRTRVISEKRQQELDTLDELIKARFVELIRAEKSYQIKLKDAVEKDRIITYGMVKPGNDVQGGVIIIKVKDFPEGEIKTNDFLHSDPALEAKYARSRVKEGDLLFSIRGTVGRTAFVTKELEGANITQDTARLSVDIKKYNADYVRFALGYDEVVREIESQIKGVAMKGISLSELREVEIPIIDFEQQSKFGEFVKQVDKSKVAVQKALNEAQLLFDSLMQEYFG